MKEVLVNNGKTILIDDYDHHFVAKFDWCATECGRTFYAKRRKRVGGRVITYYLHRELLGVTDKNLMVDHIDGNGLNNTRANLRVCSRSQNQRNRKRKINSKSRFLGVSITEQGTFCAQLTCNRKRHYLGTYKTEIEAAIAYDKMALELHGEFAKLNILTR